MLPRPIHPRLTRLAILLITLPCLINPARAQVLKAKWVEESQQRIEEVRKVDIRIIVIDKDGNPVARCPVHIEQKRHAFLFGLRLPRSLPEGAPAKVDFAATPLWRVFNAVALDAVGSWPATQPAADKWDFSGVEKLLAWSEERGLAARWGSVISSDAGRMPAWAAGLEGDDLRRAMEAHAKQVLGRYGRRVEQFDVVTQLIDHTRIEDELGIAGVRRLFSLAEHHGPGLSKASPIGRGCLAFDDALAPDRFQKVLRYVTAMREGFVMADALAIEVRLNGSLVEAPITRNLKWMGDPGLPVIITGLEIAGSSESAATLNLETALRAMFAQPCVRGIFWAGLRGKELHDEEAALIDDEGNPTEAGSLLDRMVRHLWWTDMTATTDELGNVRERVFGGQYQITARLPDGTVADAAVYLPAGDARFIVLQPVKASPRREPVAAPVEKPAAAEPKNEPKEEEPLVKPASDVEPQPKRAPAPRPRGGILRERLEP